MRNPIYNGLIAEYQKVKGTITLWIIILGSIGIPGIFFLIYFFRYKYFIPPEHQNPWDIFFQTNYQIFTVLAFPLFVIIIVAININIEHKDNYWKKLFVLPVRRELIFISKLIFLLLQVLLSLVIFLVSVFAFGSLLGLLHSELLFLDYPPEFLTVAKLLARLFISILGILSIQYLVCLWLRNIIVPISVGMSLAIVAIIIAPNWKYSIYFPYSTPKLLFLHTSESINLDTIQGLIIPEITSLVTFMIMSIAGLIYFKNKKIK